jgi:hypothetical protein
VRRRFSYPRRQQARRLRRAAGAGATGVATLAAGVVTALGGMTVAAAVLVGIAGALFAVARHHLGLARRSSVGAQSESDVRRELAALEREGWRLRHSLLWHGQGDIDHIAISPTGLAFVVETKTRTYEPRHLAAVRNQADWLHDRRHRLCPRGALPVLCVTRGHLEHIEDGVLVVSVERLPGALRARAGTAARPAFLSSTSA